MHPDWYNLLLTRTPYNFLSQWQPTGWASLGLTLFLLGLLLKFAPLSLTSFTKFIRLALITATLISLIHLVLGEIAHIPIILQLQLLRIWLIPTYLSFIAAAWLIIHFWHRNLWSRFLSLGLFVVLMTNFGKFRPGMIEFPGRNLREWDQLQLWIKNNTPVNSLILTPPQRIGFRIHSQRAIVAEIKDGSSGLYSQSLAQEWQRRISDLHWLPPKTTAEIIRLAQIYTADYLVTFRDFPHPSLTSVFQTQSFIIYQL